MMKGGHIVVDDQYYIVASSPRAAGSAVLKYGDTFAVFDRLGDIVLAESSEYGLYHDGTRHVSELTLHLGPDRPLLLGSRRNTSNHLFGVNLTNPDVLKGGVVELPRDVLHVFRARFLAQGVAYERIRIVNYSGRRVSLPLSYHVAADFIDIFEVRGVRRVRHGIALPVRISLDQLEFAYKGLDEVVRRTRLIWNPPPSAITESSARFDLVLDPRQITTLLLAIDCGGHLPPQSHDFDVALADVERSSRVRRQQYAVLSTPNDQFNAWVEGSLSDLAIMTSDTPHGPYPYAGIPWFSTIFGRDGMITALEVLWANPRLARGVLQYLAATQADTLNPEQDAEPGKILHETRGGEMAAVGEVPFKQYYGSVDSTPLFVLLAGEYFRRTADVQFIATIWPNVQRALAWMDEYGDVDRDGFLEYERRSALGLAQQGWKDSQDSVFHADGTLADAPIALCEVQGYKYAALHAAAVLASALGDRQRAEGLASRAALLKAQFHAAFWSEEIGTYALALDGRKRQCLVRSSNPGHCLFTGIVDEGHAQRVADSLMSADDLFSGWGVRTIGRREARYNPMSYHNGSLWPHDNAIAAAGLARYGLTDAAMRIVGGLFEASLYLELHRMPELFCGFRRREGEEPTLYPVACAPQSWAAGSVFLLVQALLGLSIDAVEGRVTVSQAVLPAFLPQITIRGLSVGADASVDLQFDRHAHDVGVSVLARTGRVRVAITK